MRILGDGRSQFLGIPEPWGLSKPIQPCRESSTSRAMNCEAFRHQLLTDPLSKDAAFRDHARTCPDCARAAVDVLQFEAKLHQALAAEISGAGESERNRLTPMPFGTRFVLLSLPLLLLVIWLTMRGGLGPDFSGNPGAEVIEHIQAEQEHLSADGTVSWARLSGLFRVLGVDVDSHLGPVSFADRCVIGGGEGIHLVLPGEHGAVTALFMPGKEMAGERKVAGVGLAGILVPVGFGLLAVVGVPGEPLDPIVRRLRAAVRWDGRR